MMRGVATGRAINIEAKKCDGKGRHPVGGDTYRGKEILRRHNCRANKDPDITQ